MGAYTRTMRANLRVCLASDLWARDRPSQPRPRGVLVVATTSLPEEQRTIGLAGIKKLTVPVKLEALADATQRIASCLPPLEAEAQ
jgi:hypothetical protein